MALPGLWRQALGTKAQVLEHLIRSSGFCLGRTGTGGKIYRSTNYGSPGAWSSSGHGASVYSWLDWVGDVWPGQIRMPRFNKSTDSGATWSSFTAQGSKLFSRLILWVWCSDAGSGQGESIRSTDYGATWALVAGACTGSFLSFFLHLGMTTLAVPADMHNIYKSLNCAADLELSITWDLCRHSRRAFGLFSVGAT